MRSLIVVAVVLVQSGAALDAETLYCSTWNGVRTCSSPGGYVTHESTWPGVTSGQDSDGNRWRTSRWRDFTTTTVERPDR